MDTPTEDGEDFLDDDPTLNDEATGEDDLDLSWTERLPPRPGGDGFTVTDVVVLPVPSAATTPTTTPAVAPASPSSKSSRMAERKWGKDVMSLGFCITPSLLLKAQKRLRLTPPQFVVLLHLMDIWWDEERLPWPSKRHLAERIGMGERRVQAIVAELEEAGLVTRLERRNRFGGKTSNAYDLGGLVNRLRQIAPDFIQAEAKAKRLRREAAQPGVRARPVAAE